MRFSCHILIFSALLSLSLGGCTVPKAVEEHHYHHYESDTAAVSRQVDARLTSWHRQIDSAFSERISQFVSQLHQSEQQHETVTETITESVDSLGRRIRQEQRTISRDVSRELQAIEQAITREYEHRLHTAVDSIGSAWQARYDSLSASVSRLDSASVKKTPVGDARPWHRKLWDCLQWILIGAVSAVILFVIRRRWWPIGK